MSNELTHFRVGGVPEHFNLPWHLCMELGDFNTEGIEVSWRDFPGGTGAMCKALRNDEIDIAITLTEGAVKDIVEGNPAKIVQSYIASPLIWGIHVANDSIYQTLNDLQNTTAAISRYGSGSHLLAYVNAENQGWDTSKLSFKVVRNLEGAIKALPADEAQYFMWEHFTTKPMVDEGVFRRIADCPTPWPCFVILASDKLIQQRSTKLKALLTILNATTREFKQIPAIDRMLAFRYNQKLEDIREWLSLTEWSQTQLDDSAINEVQEKLYSLNLIEKKLPVSKISVKLRQP
ncbi:substrate-binding domain-containing protein [Gangjinia marincola]|uniref:Substrate-binding domain-containing protein n=1 Tax=Gangjinia marincola TaxID=578463 RepID=A0ABN1MEW1_9FLAO